MRYYHSAVGEGCLCHSPNFRGLDVDSNRGYLVVYVMSVARMAKLLLWVCPELKETAFRIRRPIHLASYEAVANEETVV